MGFPDKVGFTDKERELTFSQAADSGKRIGTALAELGEKRPVAILIDRNCRCIEAMLGTLYAGDFYTVIDVHSPADRICHILAMLYFGVWGPSFGAAAFVYMQF